MVRADTDLCLEMLGLGDMEASQASGGADGDDFDVAPSLVDTGNGVFVLRMSFCRHLMVVLMVPSESEDEAEEDEAEEPGVESSHKKSKKVVKGANDGSHLKWLSSLYFRALINLRSMPKHMRVVESLCPFVIWPWPCI
jgi:hypothetical protein